MPANNRLQQSRDRKPTPRKFWIHFAIFVVVNAGLITLTLSDLPRVLVPLGS